MIPALNWKELEHLVAKTSSEIEGMFVERVIVPERKSYPEGYLKGEWVIRLTGKKKEAFLLLSLRPRQPYFAWSEGKSPTASIQATRSPFDLTISKALKGARVLECSTLPRDRTVILWFSVEGSSKLRQGLILSLIPAAPEAFLVTASMNQPAPWEILARSRTIRDAQKVEKEYRIPDNSKAPESPAIRTELIESYFRSIEKDLAQEAFAARLQNGEKLLKSLIKQTQDRIRQSEIAFREAQKEQDWQKLGDLLKQSLGNPPPLENSKRKVFDYVTEQTIEVPCDPKLSIQEQVEKFYHGARRKLRRIQEAQGRIDQGNETLRRFQKSLVELPEPGNWSSLEKWEKLLGIQPVAADAPKSSKKVSVWSGKTFLSKDGMTIWVGKNKDENLELTFKLARGNDIWLHVRGKPGAHAVIPLSSGKSAPLETLLDAAHLVIFYSGGAQWGKTEVDYTFKKYVKRIRDSTEASYTHNKTLIIQPDTSRTKRLLDQIG